MIDIIICGEKFDSELDTLIINNIYNQSNIVIHQSKDIPELKSNNQIIIFKNSANFLNTTASIPWGASCILNSENSSAVNLLSKQISSAISCGMSGKNTFTISSINFPRVSISLQRKISSVNHHLIEPQEFIINVKKEYEPYSIMAACATIILIYGSMSSDITL